ncbi:MAG: hypothetical protein ACRCZF_27395, partial [Gemmataceae bacterium]
RGGGPGSSGGPPTMNPDPNASMAFSNMNNGQWGNGGGAPWNNPGSASGTPRVTEEERPVVYRFGKLPKDLPGWFTSLDEDQDGQVGLYEWRKGERKTTEFLPMDLNEDGLLTAEEYIRYRAQKDGGDKASTSSESSRSSTSRSSRDDRSSGSSGSSGGRGDRDRPKGNGSNPFK